MTSSPRMSLVRAALLAGALLTCLAPGAQAAHWPGFGGDAGRSGNQPVDAGATPAELVWKQTGAGDLDVKTSVLVSGGAPAAQRVAYGTADGVVHLRRLADGDPVGGADVGDAADVFGTVSTTAGQNAASTSFADTSSEDGLGKLFAVHNEAGGIEIAHFDLADGSLRQQFAVPGTAGMTVESSLLAAPVRADGGSDLFFVAGGRLFKVAVANARQRTASFGAVISTPDVGATPLGSPTLVSLDILGTPTAHVAIGTTDGYLRTYRASDLSVGPLAQLDEVPVTEVLTASVPVQPDGRTPAAGSPVETAPVVYVKASSPVPIFGNPSTAVFMLRQDSSGDFEPEVGTLFPGEPGPSLAVTQAAEPRMQDGKLLVGTAASHFLVSTRDLDVVGNFDTNFGLSGGTTGFQQTTARCRATSSTSPTTRASSSCSGSATASL